MWVALACAPAASPPAATQEPPAGGAAPIVSIEWLARRLDDPAVRVISTGDPTVYAQGHIPGAAFVARARTLDANRKLIGPDALAAVLAEAGASDDTHIVLYGEHAMVTGWLYMTFASLGHADHVSILDGNLAAWRAAGHRVATDAPAPRPGRLTPRPAPDVVVGAEWVRERLENPAVKVLDVRTGHERAEGYLPGSTLVLWQDLYSDVEQLRFKSKDEIRALLRGAGVSPGRQAVTYCAVGMRASLMYFAARYAGVPARVYVGSWADWRTKPGYPVAR